MENTELTHLSRIIDKLQKKIAEVQSSVESGLEDINRMHQYYWENYTEMDEYGYENYDNQQALKSRVSDNQEKQKLLYRYQRMAESPYFGRIDFIYEGEDEAETFYIGIGDFAEKPGSMPLIFDWRAPVSGLFYDYDKGAAAYEAPGGMMSGEITAKWQYKIRHGKLEYAFESDIKIDDDILMRELGMHANAALKSIVTSIQKEQNAIIRNKEDRILVVQGSAGSGKTSIALHRIAYLLYHDRNKLAASQVLVLSPNSIFSDYISHILPELGEESIREMSFDDYAYHELKKYTDCEDRYDQMERSLSEELCDERLKKRRRYKQSEEFARELYGYVLELESDGISFRDIKFDKIVKTAGEIEHLFYYKFPDIPFLKRMEAVAEYFIDEDETLRDRDMPPEDRDIFIEKMMHFYRSRDYYKIYSDFLESIGEDALPDVPVEERLLPYEDVFPVLYLKYLLEGAPKKEVRHLVIDEMQDYSYLQYLLIEKLFSCKMTIVGDRAQTMEEERSDVLRFLPKIFGKNIRTLEIRKSYRSTEEIASYAAGLIGDDTVEIIKRHGEAPAFFEGKDTELLNTLLCRVQKEQNNGMETIGILCMTEKDAQTVYKQLEKKLSGISYLDKNSRKFHAGIVVTTFYLAKGLEFDCVHAVTRKEYDTPLHRQGLYICATRALHRLGVYTIEDAEDSAAGI